MEPAGQLKVYTVCMNFTFHPLVDLWELFGNNLGKFDKKWYIFWNYSGKMGNKLGIIKSIV